MNTKQDLCTNLAEQILNNQISLEELEGTLIQQALTNSTGNVSVAARLLGLSRAAFAYRLKRIQDE